MVLLDLGLPKLDGLEVARRLREANGDLSPVLVALTGYGQPEDHRRTTEAGFDHHLTKPVQPGVLRDVLSSVEPRSAGDPMPRPSLLADPSDSTPIIVTSPRARA